MNIIKYLLCLLKARFTILSYEDFGALCQGVDKQHSKIAGFALKIYLSCHAPTDGEVDRICVGSDELKLLYLRSIRPERRLSDYEQLSLVRYIPIGGRYRFPSALREPALKELFEKATPQKVGDYARSFALPSDYELRLIELCRTEEPTHFSLNTYKKALQCYLVLCKGRKLLTPDVQLSILALDDEKMASDMIGNCNLSENILFLPVQKILAEQGSFKVLQELLFRSYITSEELSQKILQRFPSLKWAYEISRLRKPLRRMEKELEQFWGVEAPTPDEMRFIEKYFEKNIQDDERHELFVRHKVKPLIATATPYFCAWVAREFPELGETAYQRVRNIAEFYRDIYKRKK